MAKKRAAAALIRGGGSGIITQDIDGNGWISRNLMSMVLGLIIVSVGYLYYAIFVKDAKGAESKGAAALPQSIILTQSTGPSLSATSALDGIYVPPLNTIDVRGPVELPPQPLALGGIPVNIRTSSANTAYRQIGILTKNARDGRGGDPLILPLMGRNLLNGRDKWQYYTAANSGGMTFNAKLPVSVNGRSCTGEYGCDRVSNGDTVYVEGYEDTFRATIYENASMNYIPF